LQQSDHRHLHVIVAIGSVIAVRASKAATNTIPIIFGFGADAVQQGLVASLNRPGGNITGMTSLSNELVGKQLAESCTSCCRKLPILAYSAIPQRSLLTAAAPGQRAAMPPRRRAV
jgi:putative ABC transport system substrate-binding protein